MSEERKKILEMLAAGTINADEAERLLEKLGKLDQSSESHVRSEVGEDVARVDEVSFGGRLKFLRILVDEKSGDKVNIRVPLGLLRTGLKLTTMVPESASAKLSESGIDLSHLAGLEGEALIEELRDLKVDVDSDDGDTVRIFCE